MKSEDLIRMANQIAAFYAVYPHDEAIAGVAGHIRDFWEPRMKRELAAVITSGGHGLEPLVLEAASSLKLAA